LVCKSWCNIIDTEAVKLKFLYSKFGNNLKLRRLPWYMLTAILQKDFLEKNLLKNPDGSESYSEHDSTDGKCGNLYFEFY